MQDKIRKIDNFFKHGYRDINEELDFWPFYSEVLMLDSVDCHTRLFCDGTPWMRLYSARFMMCNVDILGAKKSVDPLIVEGISYGLDQVDRREFFDKLWPSFNSAG